MADQETAVNAAMDGVGADMAQSANRHGARQVAPSRGRDA